jgi:HK97 gp10 family phage protein
MSKELIEIQGFAELQQKIMNLADDRSKKRELISVLRQVAATTVRVAKQNAPVSKRAHTGRGKTINPGNLKKSIGVIVGKKGSAKENPVIFVGPRAKGSNNGWYGHFVEYGVNVYNKGFKRKRKAGANDGAAVRRTKANEFMKKTYQQTGGKVSDEAATKVAAFIQKKINKLSAS